MKCQDFHKLLLKNFYLLLLASLPLNCISFGQDQNEDSTNIFFNLITVPSNASVYLDSVYMGITPLFFNAEKKNKYLLRLEAEEYTPYNGWIKPENDTIKLKITMKINYSWVKVETNETDSKIYLDDSIHIFRDEFSRIPTGIHKLRVENSAGTRYIEREFESGATDTIGFKTLMGVSSFFPVALSAVVPGTGQYYDNSKLEGTVFFIGTVSALLFGINANNQKQSAYEEYQDSYNNYLNANDEETADKFRDESIAKQDEVNSYTKQKNWYFGITLGLYLFNLIDAYLFHSFDDFLLFDKKFSNVSITPFVLLRQQGINLGIQFTL